MMNLRSFTAYKNGKISRKEMFRYQELKVKLIGLDSFVEVQDTKDWKEFIRKNPGRIS